MHSDLTYSWKSDIISTRINVNASILCQDSSLSQHYTLKPHTHSAIFEGLALLSADYSADYTANCSGYGIAGQC